jgi:hypothetical protein
MVERLDEQKLELLRGWGDGLVRDPRDPRKEVRAAGRAILLLVEEIERLHVDLWNERSLQRAVVPVEDEAGAIQPDLQSSLRARFALVGRRRRSGVSGESA